MAKVTPILKISERDLEKLIIDWLESRRCSVRNNRTAGIPSRKYGITRNPNKGCPDLTVCIHPEGKMFEIEVKIKGNKPTPEQLEELRKTHCAGGIAIVAYSLEDVVQAYDNFKKEAKHCKHGKLNNDYCMPCGRINGG